MVRLPRKHKHHRIHHRRASAVSTGAVKNEINVTPLVDVVLVLLIIFMVVTPMLSRGAKVEMPETEHHEKRQDTGEQLVVSISLDGRIFVESDQVEGDQLVPAIKKAITKHGGKDIHEIHVKADRRLEYATVRKVLEKIHEAGAPAVALGTEDRKKEGGK